MDFNGDLACRFEKYLNGEIDRLKPQAICEEYNKIKLLEHLKIDSQAYLVGERVCLLRGSIRHVFCDPDQCERDALYAAHRTTVAADEMKGWPIREGEWLRRITPLLPDTSILFICGANHIKTFRQKLGAKRIDTLVICEDLERKFNAIH